MNDIDRRKLLVGSGLAFSLAACNSKTGGNASADAESTDDYKMAVFDPADNHGHEPWDSATTGAIPFEPQYIALVYINLRSHPSVELNIVRAHFPIDPSLPSKSRWADIEPSVSSFIQHLNGLTQPAQPGAQPDMPYPSPIPTPTPLPTGSPTPMPSQPETYPGGPKGNKCWRGLDDFAFNQQHHVVLYIRNDGIEYDEHFPIFFAKQLQGKVLGYPATGKVADPNNSFYDAHVKPVSGGAGWSQSVIHFKNYYQIPDVRPNTYKKITGEHLVYSFNINAIFKTNRKSGMPVIFDPDTGNMGEGQP